MNRTSPYIISLIFLSLTACTEFDDRPEVDVEIPEFNFPKTVEFEPRLSAYGMYAGTPSELVPSDSFHMLELSSVLFTDYAHKQRLVKVPAGTQMVRLNDGSIDFPDGTLLVKTFFYYHDERDTSLGKRVIETRLLIKETDTWNIATYLWNQDQTDAALTLDGVDTSVSWINADGTGLSTRYHVPTENECMTCHQSNSTMTTLGPTLRNLNRVVERNGTRLNQLRHLQSVGVLNEFQVSQVPQMVDYHNPSASLTERGRAYLAMNCAHCHNPGAWKGAAEQNLDVRYDTPLAQTGLSYQEDRIIDLVSGGNMPFIGTTMLDQEGLKLLTDFVESL